jgi:hypothetical protein
VADIDILKIGIAEDIADRIRFFESIYKIRFELVDSFVVGCHSADKIRALETDLLANTAEFKLTEDILSKISVDSKNRNGSSEFRFDKCFDIIAAIIKSKQEITGEYYIMEGISLERNIAAKLPAEIFNSRGETEYIDCNVSKILLDTIRNSDASYKSHSNDELINLILNRFRETNNIVVSGSEEEQYTREGSKYFAFRHKKKNWYWSVPADSKLKNYLK